jgi:GIY-YIG catalytic domain-containing protein
VNRRCALYRLFDAIGTLLYIGITVNPEGRWSVHAATKTWWGDVARKEIEWYDSEELADAAETAAILAEHPKYNVAKSPWAPKPRELAPGEMLIGAAAARFGAVLQRVSAGETITLVGMDRNRTPRAAIISAELADLAEAVGGPDRAADILRQAIAAGVTE